MSTHMTSLVWKIQLPAVQKLILLKLADCANDDGSKIFPAVMTIAKECGVGRRTVQRTLQDFVTDGTLFLIRKGGGRFATEYAINVLGVSQWHGCQSDTGATVAPQGCHSDTAGVPSSGTAGVPSSGAPTSLYPSYNSGAQGKKTKRPPRTGPHGPVAKSFQEMPEAPVATSGDGVPDEYRAHWNEILGRLTRELGSDKVAAWLVPLVLNETEFFDGQTRLHFKVATAFRRESIKRDFLDPLIRHWSHALGAEVEIVFHVTAEKEKAA